MSIDPGYSGFTMTSRLDSFMVGDLPRFVEYNAESPAGIGFCDIVVARFPENVLFEVGPHSFGHLAHLVGGIEDLTVAPKDRIELPNGKEFFRRWEILGSKGTASIRMPSRRSAAGQGSQECFGPQGIGNVTRLKTCELAAL